jgi:hypothetical protein
MCGKNLYGKKGSDIRADGHESRMPHGKLSHVAVYKVETQCEDDIDAYIHDDKLDIGIEKLELLDDEGEYENEDKQGRQQPALRLQLLFELFYA